MEENKSGKPRKRVQYKRLFVYAEKYKILTILSMFLSGVSAVIALIPFVYIWKIVKEALTVMPDFSKMTDAVHNGWMAVLFALLYIVVYFAALMCSHIAAFRIARNIRQKSVDHVVTLPSGVLSSLGSGKVRSIITDSSAATETFLAHQTPDMAAAFVTQLAIVCMLFFFDWRFSIASLIPVFIALLCMMQMTGKQFTGRMKQYNNALNDMSNEAVEYVRGIAVVKTFGQTASSFSRLKNSIDRYSKWVKEYTITLRKPMMEFTLCVNGVFFALIAAAFIIKARFAGGLESVFSSENAAFLTNFLFYIIFTPVIAVTMNKIMFSSENTMIVNDAMNRIDSILSIKPLPETRNPKTPASYDVSIENVSFCYDGAKNQAIHNVSLRVNQGKTIALVGPSGGGKTTLASLVSRFFDVDSGCIKIGGIDIRDISKEKLMQTVSYVFQDSKLLKMSILENVRMGRPSASKDEVLAALQKAQCSDIIEKLPQGIDSVYGSKGIYLSGGECQRIAFARTILNDTPIVVLDEATAFADPENEYLLQKAFTELSADKTVIMIAHRLSTVKNADCIYVLENGSVKESGTIGGLIAKGGLFALMWNEYQKSVSWSIENSEEKDGGR